MKPLFLWFISLIGISLLAAIFYRFDLLSFRSNFALDFIDVPARFFRKPIVEDISLCQEEKNALEIKNRSLEKEVVRIKNELMVRVDLTKESEEAEIVNIFQDKMIINQGASSSISINHKVIIGQSLVGVILETEKKRSLVGLLNNPRTKVFCGGGLLTGKPDGKIYLTKILQTKRLKEKDEIYCGGFYAGTVRHIIKNESNLFYEAEIAPRVNPENLEKVYVVED